MNQQLTQLLNDARIRNPEAEGEQPAMPSGFVDRVINAKNRRPGKADSVVSPWQLLGRISFTGLSIAALVTLVAWFYFTAQDTIQQQEQVALFWMTSTGEDLW